MRTVYTQNELEEAIKAHEEKILCKGEIARQFAKKKKENGPHVLALAVH